MHTIGSLPRTLPEVYPHRHTEGLDIEAFYRAIDWHVALAPLIHTKFNRSKSHLKALEANMLGLPILASDTPAYQQFVRHGETGFLIGKPKQWGEYLDLLANDQELRMAMSVKAREHAEDHTIENNAHRWLEAFTRLVAS